MLEIRRTPGFDRWLRRLRDGMARKRIAARLLRMEDGNLGDYALVGDGVFELRLHFGPGYRLYFVFEGQTVIILLCGGDKDSQDRDIVQAKNIARLLEERP